MNKNKLYRSIPKVDVLLENETIQDLVAHYSRDTVMEAIHMEMDKLREFIGQCEEEDAAKAQIELLLAHIEMTVAAMHTPNMCMVINGTGTILHTNLGRAPIGQEHMRRLSAIATGYSNLEYNLEAGRRGERYSHFEKLLCKITGAEAAMAVNNNAAAVMLILSSLAKGGEVVVSRGELVEIGGSFRIPDIMTQCGCTLREVGTTNKTHLFDYENAIGEETRALLRVHTSNYRIVGFSERPPLAELVELGRRHGLPVIEDLGSGSLADLAAFGIHDEPTVQQSVKAGVDLISFSGDKLLGGPQAGLILGKKRYIDQLKKHPLARAVRVDKMTIAALRETLYAYLDPARAREEIPALSMLGESLPMLHSRAALLCQRLADQGCAAQVVETESQVGGGSCPAQTLPSWAVAVEPGRLTVDGLEEALRRREKPVIGRISQGRYLLDVRTLRDEDLPDVEAAVKEALQ